MDRLPEPELMEDPVQVAAYAAADFAEAHQRLVGESLARVGGVVAGAGGGRVLDLGCGPGDVTVRLARALPDCRLLGIDGSAEMLKAGRARVKVEGLADRIELAEVCLPDPVPDGPFDGVFSNSLLHHLRDPMVLWSAVDATAAPGAAVAIMDLRRPPDAEALADLVGRYALSAAPVVRRDFTASLFAAFEVDEITAQLAEAGLDWLTAEPIGDRHLIVTGRRPT